MKGGITSGVVYPPAILELAKKYRFRSIGGASAGAIAAAAAAAAEFGRESKTGGFRALQAMQDELMTPGFLLKLFQPSRATRPLYDFALGLKHFVDTDERHARVAAPDLESQAGTDLPASIWRWAPRLTALLGQVVPRSVWAGRAAGAAVGLVPAAVVLLPVSLLSARAAGGLTPFEAAGLGLTAALALLLVLVAGVAGGLAGGALSLKRAYDSLANPERSSFGFCRGSHGPGERPEKSGETPALTDWLSRSIQKLAGLPEGGDLLTIGMLRNKTIRVHQEGVEVEQKVSIEFKMVTTNLSHGRPYVFPRRDQSLLFRARDMRRLFPREVVKHLIAKAPPLGNRRVRLPAGWYLLPADDDLPVVVATRLSLSFPVLLSAVRLYTFREGAAPGGDAVETDDTEAHYPPVAPAAPIPCDPPDEKTIPLLDPRTHLEENWFSDGGIATNFPLSMFDTWLPTRPTFGINLCDAPFKSRLPTASEQASDPDVFLPKARDRVLPRPVPIGGFFAFFAAILETARSYRDNTQMALASYRERVAQIYLEHDEGGLNLEMKSDVLEKINAKGKKAADLFLGEFDFAEHRWVRTRLLLAHIERELGHVRNDYRSRGAGAPQMPEDYAKLFQEQLARAETKDAWYRPASEAWCNEATRRLKALHELMIAWEIARPEGTDGAQGREAFFDVKPPSPGGALRVAPDL